MNPIALAALFVLAFVLFVGAFIFAVYAYRGRVIKIFEKWAQSSGLQILCVDFAWFHCGCFAFRSKNQTVLRFHGLDKAGARVDGFALVGGFWEGALFSEKIKIKYDGFPCPPVPKISSGDFNKSELHHVLPPSKTEFT